MVIVCVWNANVLCDDVISMLPANVLEFFQHIIDILAILPVGLDVFALA